MEVVTREYWEKLDAVASAPDDLFPDLLMNPLFNPFEERYHEMDLDDTHNKAVDYDFRFTRERISRIRPSTKRIDHYLEWVELFDAYTAYLIETYGSMEVVKAMQDEGIFEDPIMIRRRPYLRRKSQRDLLAAGLVPSFYPAGYDPIESMEWIKRVCDEDVPDVSGQEEPDIEWAVSREPSKQELKLLEDGMLKYRRSQRLAALTQGTKTGGIWAITDWVDDYYGHLARGDYETNFSLGTTSNLDLTALMAEIANEEYLTESERIDRARGINSAKKRLFYDGSQVTRVDQQKEDEKLFIKDLYEQGVDLIGGMKRAGVSRKAIRRMYEEAGIQTAGMTAKEVKKLEKERKKAEKTMTNIMKGHSVLSQTLKTNRLLMGNGTIRFEDGL